MGDGDAKVSRHEGTVMGIGPLRFRFFMLEDCGSSVLVMRESLTANDVAFNHSHEQHLPCSLASCHEGQTYLIRL